VVAVNAYDEPRDVIGKFVATQKLTHPILMMGSKLSHEQYFCSAYPTTYFLDRHGNVIERTMGFDASEVDELEQRVRDLLARPIPGAR
jgi:hypothetical protein